jgi:cytochrome c biogenesis protein
VGLKREEVYKKVLNFFSSSRLAIVLFIIIAIGSIIGTIIPQGKSEYIYIKEYGRNLFEILKIFGLTDLYHSLWFISILVILSINTSVCFLRRFPKNLRLIKEKRIVVSEDFINNLKNHLKINMRIGIQDAKKRIEELLRRRRYNILVKNSPKEISIYGYKGAIGRLGSDISHISIIVIFIGAIIGNIAGFKDYINIYEGEKVFIDEGGFELELNKFYIEYYDNGSPKDYKSVLSVIDNGKEVLRRTIEVNHPLKYKGIWFYQSSYGYAWDKIYRAHIKVKNNGKDLGEYVIDYGKKYKIGDIEVKLVSFLSDLSYNPDTNSLFLRSREHNNPAIQLELYKGDSLIEKPWIFMKLPYFSFPKIQDYSFELIDYEVPSYSGLQIAKDPGVNIVWFGCFLLILGMILSFFIYNKKIWVKILKGKKGAQIYIGGIINKNEQTFEKEFSEIVKEIKNV